MRNFKTNASGWGFNVRKHREVNTGPFLTDRCLETLLRRQLKRKVIVTGRCDVGSQFRLFIVLRRN